MNWITSRVSLLILASFVGLVSNPGAATSQSVFSNEDRLGLKVGSDSIRHTRLGFVLPTPGKDLTPSPALQEQMAALFGGELPPDLAIWAFQDTTQHFAFGIQVIGMPGLNEEKFRNYSRGMREGLSKTKVVIDTTIWEGSRRETRFVGQHPNGVYIGARCVPSMKPRREYVLCIQTYSGDVTTLAKIGGGLTVY